MNSSTMRRRVTRTASVLAASALALGGTLAFAAPANAAEAAIDDAVFSWGVNVESNAAAFAPGTFNFLSAGSVAATSAADRVTAANWKQREGNVSILKLQSDGSSANADFAGLRTDAAGTTITVGNRLSSGHIARISGGTGTVDPDANTAEIQWTGTFTTVYYSGMTRSWITDPHLSVAPDGTATVTATVDGYGSSMDDPEKFEELDAVEDVTIATLTGVDVDADGFTVTPDYLGRAVDTRGGVAQDAAGQHFGSFPQEYVDFQRLTGQHSYWFSSGGAADARKPAAPLSVSYSLPAPPAAPAVTVSKTTGLDRGGETVTVTGTGFVPAGVPTTGTRPPLSGRFVGAYVVFGKFADVWQPSAGAPSTARGVNLGQKWAVDQAGLDALTAMGAGASAVLIQPDGSFSVELPISAANDGAAGNYGIYTYAGSGASYAPFETYTPVTFANASDVTVQVPTIEKPSGAFSWKFADPTPANLGTAAQNGASFVASGSLSDIIVTDTRKGGTAPYSWTVSGRAGDFAAGTQTFSGGFLGWTPKLVSGAATVGSAVTSTQTGGTGLASSRVLASSNAAASATVGADLSLVIPGTTAAGAYASKITITALAN